MANGEDKKWWQRRKKKDEEEEVVTEEPQEPQKYQSDPTMEPKDYFNYHRDKIISDERFNRLDNEGRKAVLGKFFDKYGKDYLDQIGETERFDTFKDRWVTSTFEKHRIPDIKKKEEPDPEDLADLPDYSSPNHFAQFDIEVAPAVSTYISPNIDLEAQRSAREYQQNLQQQFPAIYDQVVSTDDFGYIKDAPGYFLERNDESTKDLNKWLKKNTELGDSERRAFMEYAKRSAGDLQTGKLREQWEQRNPGQDLNKIVEEAAAPFIEDYEPGTFLDPETDQRVKDPQTDIAAEYLSYMDKESQKLLQDLVNIDVSNPLSEQKTALEQEHEQLNQQGEALDELVKQAEELAQNTELEEGEYLLKYAQLTEQYDNAYNEYIDNLDKFNAKVEEYEQKLQDLPKQVEGNKTIEERLRDVTNDAYLEWQYYEDRFNSLGRQFRGEEASLQKPDPKTMANANRMRYNAKAKFEAATRMLYNQEGPTSIDKDWSYMGEVFGQNLLKGMGAGKSGEQLAMYDDATQQEVLMAMSQIGHEIGVEFTPEEKEAMELTLGEGVVAGAGHLMPAMVELILLGRATSLVKGATGLSKMKNGYRIIKNAELGKARVIGLKDAVPTGWQVAREFKPTNFQKAYAFIAESFIDEAVFAGAGGFELGAITGMNTAHMVLPDVRFKGRLQAFNPLLDIFYKSGIGATIGMEAGGIGAEAFESMITDQKFSDAINELYPNAEETSKRFLQNFIVNSVLFGGMGMVTTGMAKQSSAPMGAKFDRFGQANWYAYFSPGMRDKMYRTAKDFEAKGYPDAARELYTWLDLTKDPVTAEQMKKARMENMTEAYSILPIGHIREMRDLHGEAIRMLEYQGRQPDFKGSITLPIRSYADVKLGSVVSVDGKHYEVTGREVTREGMPVKFKTVDVETGEVRTFEPKEGKFEFGPSTQYKLNHPLEIPQRLEAHYEMVNVLDRIIRNRGRYGEQFKLQAGPEPPTGLPPATGEIYVKPPEPTKVQKKRAELEEKQREMKETTGVEPIEMPEYMVKEYSYGKPEEVMESPVKDFSESLRTRQEEVDATIEGYNKQIEDLKTQMSEQFKGRLDLQQRKERAKLQDEIDRLTIASQRLDSEFQNEVSEWVEAARPFIETQITDLMPEATPEQVNEILGDLWQSMTQPSEAELGQSIGEILKTIINEKATKKQDTVQPVQPEVKADEEIREEEELPEEIAEVEDLGEGLSIFKEGDQVGRRTTGRCCCKAGI
jgi:hypothetical protein